MLDDSKPNKWNSGKRAVKKFGSKSPKQSLYFDSYSNLTTEDEKVSFSLNTFFNKVKIFLKSFNFPKSSLGIFLSILFFPLTLLFLILLFIIDLIGYIAVRSRVLFVLSAVLSEVLARQFEFLKKLFVRKMFWGRGGVFRFAVQFMAALLVVGTIVLSGYRSRITEAATEDVLVAKSQGYSNDLAVQNSSTKTVTSENSVRFEPSIYVVKGGDTLSRIAEYFGISPDAVLWANNMNEYDVLHPGMELKIPPGDGVYVTVKSGDTVETLAKKYNAHPQNIVEYNYLSPPYDLEKGSRLFLPGGSIEKPVIVKKPTSTFTGIVTGRATGGTGTVTHIDPAIGRFVGWPVQGGAGHVSQCYHSYHNGVDIADSTSPNLVAAAPGTVTLAGCQSGSCPSGQLGGKGLAWAVIIDHHNGFSTVYGHMSTGHIVVKTGDNVARGQVIGRMGQSGRAYGIHVHFMVVKSGTWKSYHPAAYMINHICGY